MINKSKKILSEISAGELLDKISILKIKLEKIKDKKTVEDMKKLKKMKEPVDYDDSLKENMRWFKDGKEPRVLEDDEKNKSRVGFLAQDVGEVLEELGFDSNNDIVDIDEETTI